MKLKDYEDISFVSDECKTTKCKLVLTDTGLDYDLVINFTYDSENEQLIPITLEHNNLSIKLENDEYGGISSLEIRVYSDKYISLIAEMGMYSSNIYMYDNNLNLIYKRTERFLHFYEDGIKYRKDLFGYDASTTDRLYNPKNSNYDPNRVVAYTYYEEYIGEGKFGNREIIENIIARTDYPSSAYTE